MARTMLSEGQINFRKIFAPEKILRSRGFDVKVLSQPREIQQLIQDPYSESSKLTYDRLLDSKQREYILASVTDEIDRALFSKQFEWLIGEIFVKEFESFSHSNGVIVDNRKELGDLDTIVTTRDLSFIYIECKSGTFNSHDISKALERGLYIHSEAVIVAYRKELSEMRLVDMVRSVTYPSIGSSELTLEKIEFGRGPTIYRARECYFIQIEDDAFESIRGVMRTLSVEKNMLGFSLDIGADGYLKFGLKVERIL